MVDDHVAIQTAMKWPYPLIFHQPTGLPQRWQKPGNVAKNELTAG
jgi:hypothetical protein